MSGSLPLSGITVVALEQAVAVPFATRQLADLGARVIKIERPGAGDFARGYDKSVLGQASYFVWLNRGKESVQLDVKSPEGIEALTALLAGADVFLQNLGPGAAGRLGLAAADLLARHPRLICGTVSGYGTEGPYAGKKAYDLLVQCETGVLSVTGTPEEPCKTGISVADIAAGMYAYSGVLTALYERERTGRGSSFEVSLLDALGEWMTQPYYYTVYGGTEPVRTGARHASISPYGPYAARGGQVFLGLQNDREWVVLCEQVLGRPELDRGSAVRRQPGPRGPRRRAAGHHRGRVRGADAAGGGGPAGRGRHRQRPAADPGRVRRAPAAGGPGPVARGGHPGRPGPHPAPAGHRARPRAGHGRRPGPRPAHRLRPG